MPTRLQIIVPDPLADEWRAASRSMGMPIGAWIRLQLANKAEMPNRVHEDAQTASLWSRIHAIVGSSPILRGGGVGNGGFGTWSVPVLARKLGVPEKSIYAALHSRMASKRMMRVGDEYLTKGE